MGSVENLVNRVQECSVIWQRKKSTTDLVQKPSRSWTAVVVADANAMQLSQGRTVQGELVNSAIGGRGVKMGTDIMDVLEVIAG